MSVQLRILLFVFSILTFLYVARKIKKTQIGIMDALFWIVFSALIMVLGIFPEIGVFFANKLGVDSAVNFVYLIIIFLLFARVFLLEIRVSNTEFKISDLVQELSVREQMNHREDK